MSGVSFKTIKSVKDYLASRIADEAVRLNQPLTEVEREMLYFTEDGGLSPKMRQVNEAFERDYDDEVNERKIANVVRGIEAQQNPDEQKAWNNAVIKLCEGDHCLLVLINGAKSGKTTGSLMAGLGPWLPTSDSQGRRPPGDWIRLMLVAAGFSGLLVIALVIAALFR